MSKPRELEISDLVTGMIAARKNARDLIEEADLLTEHRRHARAYALLHTACEELGKLAIMEIAARQIALGRTPRWKRFWTRLRSHDSKSMQLELQLRLLAARPDGSEELGGLAKTLFSRGLIVRNAAFYVEEAPDGRFRAPSEINFDVPLPAIRALAAEALRSAEQRGDQQAIETELQKAQQLADLPGVSALLQELLREARNAGITREQVLDKMNKLFDRTS